MDEQEEHGIRFLRLLSEVCGGPCENYLQSCRAESSRASRQCTTDGQGNAGYKSGGTCVNPKCLTCSSTGLEMLVKLHPQGDLRNPPAVEQEKLHTLATPIYPRPYYTGEILQKAYKQGFQNGWSLEQQLGKVHREQKQDWRQRKNQAMNPAYKVSAQKHRFCSFAASSRSKLFARLQTSSRITNSEKPTGITPKIP